MKMEIWILGRLNQPLKEALILKLNFQKNKVVGDKTPFFSKGTFAIHCLICLDIGFWQGGFVWKLSIN